MKEIGIMEVGGFRVGHAQNPEAGTGITVILCDRLSPAGLDVRGGGPASRESQILNPLMNAEGINAVVLSGGSAFGLDAAGGVQKYLEERGEGFAVGSIRVPLVCQSCVFDLGVGRHDIRPDAAMAYEACCHASDAPPEEGNVGVGTGCSVGKIMGMERAMKTGFGTYALEAGNIRVGAMVAVNAAGDVYGADGRVMAGLLCEDQMTRSSTFDAMVQGVEAQAGANTTIGVIVTNVRLPKNRLCKVAGMAHNGYARAVRPVHTSGDGDSIYALSTGDVEGNMDAVGALGAYAMEMAIRRAAEQATGAYGLKAMCDL